MKTINKTLILLVLCGFITSACSDLLDVNSDRLVFDRDNTMKSDSLYAMFGIFSKLQKLAGQHVILGELRGDLLETSANADLYLQRINLFDFSGDNPYIRSKKDYYAIINNCNYVIHNVDTSVVSKGEKAMYKVMAAAKAIRAWTYMQLALNCGDVIYYDKPLLTLDDVFANYPTIELNELAAKLIDDLLPYRAIPNLNPGSFGGYDRNDIMYISIPFLLGDLYLWTGQYENAANMYHELMVRRGCRIHSNYRSYWGVVGTGATMRFNGTINDSWINVIFPQSSGFDGISVIPVSNEYEYNYSLDSLFTLSPRLELPLLLASKKAVTNYDSAVYFHDYYREGTAIYSLDTIGDLRKYGSINDSYYTYWGIIQDIDRVVGKYRYLNYVQEETAGGNEAGAGQDKQAKIVSVYRNGLLYLRYAEAVNRLQKPNLAMAVLKHGLKRTTLMNRTIIPEKEAPDPLPSYMDFNAPVFDNNIGIHARGLGQTNRDTTFFIIGNRPTLQDSILYVEDLILQELALETAFEGNRFHDLMRFAIRRNDNDYLAGRVAEKYTNPATKEAILTKLRERGNWYVK